ncbi:MAG: DUF6691 family protein [Planctomycetota bacterium]
MLPLGPEGLGAAGPVVAPLAIGFLFGFVLERAGFGDARRLAAQFYLHEMRVLKVMFGAIVVAMLVLSWGDALVEVDLSRLAVNETYLTTGILGGLLLGAGFIVGGYCPGTSLVAAATGKVDGLFFVLGVLLGVFVFGETVDLYGAFYDQAGRLGNVTLPEVLGAPRTWVVLGVVLLALGAFAGAERAERAFAHLRPREEEPA